eukprot:TRINITY_DN1653_c0_g1_i1.p1 TRINITY_DN1653_c0_g1~~TRINITY_DN1653_c0_g1_i1.p1  ORF type:complete len:543 (+),score=121.40 TRINITY_DN1653_c0_g1_i1:98-1630(+)
MPAMTTPRDWGMVPGAHVVASGTDVPGQEWVAGRHGVLFAGPRREGDRLVAVVDFPNEFRGAPPRRVTLPVDGLRPVGPLHGTAPAALPPQYLFQQAVGVPVAAQPPAVQPPAVQPLHSRNPATPPRTPSSSRAGRSPPRGQSPATSAVLVLKEVPWDIHLDRMKQEVTQAVHAEVVRMLPLWNKGMVLVELDRRVTFQGRCKVGSRGMVAELSDKDGVKQERPSAMLNARFIVLNPQRDFQAQPQPDEVAAYDEAKRRWPPPLPQQSGKRSPPGSARCEHPRPDQRPGRLMLQRLGQALHEGCSDPWLDMRVPLWPMRHTEQHIEHCRRLYTQLFFRFRDEATAQAAARSGDGQTFVCCGLWMVVRLEPVPVTAVGSEPLMENSGVQLPAMPSVEMLFESWDRAMEEADQPPPLADLSPGTPGMPQLTTWSSTAGSNLVTSDLQQGSGSSPDMPHLVSDDQPKVLAETDVQKGSPASSPRRRDALMKAVELHREQALSTAEFVALAARS